MTTIEKSRGHRGSMPLYIEKKYYPATGQPYFWAAGRKFGYAGPQARLVSVGRPLRYNNEKEARQAAENHIAFIQQEKQEAGECPKAGFSYKRLFKPDESYTVGVIGSTKSGKTTFLEELYSKIYSQNDLIIFFVGSLYSGAYTWIRPRDITFTTFNADIIRTLLLLQEQRKALKKKMLKITIILDDTINVARNAMIKKLFAMARNFDISTIMSVQDFTYITKSARNNFNYVFLLRNTTNSKDIVNIFLRPVLIPPEHLKQKYKQTQWLQDYYMKGTQDHGILVVDFISACVYPYRVGGSLPPRG